MGVSPEHSQEVKAPRVVNGDGCDGRGVVIFPAYAPLNPRSAEKGAARGSPTVGGLIIRLGILIGQEIFSRPTWWESRANGIPEEDAANQGDR